MLQKVIIAAATVALWSAAAEAAEITGYLHNNRAEGRATLETGDGVYLLDFGTSYLLDISERHDRKRVRVRGTLSYPRDATAPVLRVESMTFRPYSGAPITYSIWRHEPRREPPYEQPRYRRHYTGHRRY